MKNIYILPTDFPSKLALQLNNQPNYNLQFSEQISTWTFNWQKQNIYITSDEEIKDGNWCIDDIENIFKIENLEYFKKFCKKIILTTDQELIENGIQTIDDEFLKYYVSVPFGEMKEIKVEKDYIRDKGYVINFKYKIIIPKEESPVQFNINYPSERSYSEEDMRKAFIAGFTPKITTTLNDSFNKWFEIYKNKV